MLWLFEVPGQVASGDDGRVSLGTILLPSAGSLVLFSHAVLLAFANWLLSHYALALQKVVPCVICWSSVNARPE
jgi:hypothetical protein